jgi:hypothetical protein
LVVSKCRHSSVDINWIPRVQSATVHAYLLCNTPCSQHPMHVFSMISAIRTLTTWLSEPKIDPSPLALFPRRVQHSGYFCWRSRVLDYFQLRIVLRKPYPHTFWFNSWFCSKSSFLYGLIGVFPLRALYLLMKWWTWWPQAWLGSW